jgi:hypothetical protein
VMKVLKKDLRDLSVIMGTGNGSEDDEDVLLSSLLSTARICV